MRSAAVSRHPVRKPPMDDLLRIDIGFNTRNKCRLNSVYSTKFNYFERIVRLCCNKEPGHGTECVTAGLTVSLRLLTSGDAFPQYYMRAAKSLVDTKLPIKLA
jgi:hypothetical protein